jgi:glycosyltransferase involved in cell wall biosynthesis
MPKWRKLQHQFAAATQAVRENGPFDLVHSQHFPAADCDVVTIHNHSVPHLAGVGSYWENALNWAKGKVVPAYRMRNHYDRILCRRARSFVFPALVCRDDFYRAFGDFFPIRLVPYVVARPGADLHAASSVQPSTACGGREAVGQAGGPFTFLFVGRGYRRKGLDTVLRACKILRARKQQFKLLVAGLPGRPLDILRLKLMGLEENVEYLGFRKDMENVYARASAFVLPSRHDVFGMAPLQAMHWGIVPIVSRCMGVAELLSDHQNALLLEDQLDADALAAQMQELMSDRDLLDRMSRNARLIPSTTTWDKCVEATLEAYRLAADSTDRLATGLHSR